LGSGLLWGLCACVQGNLVRLRTHYAEQDLHPLSDVGFGLALRWPRRSHWV